MAELFEFALVVLASTLFAGASVVTYSSFSSFETGVQGTAALSRLVTMAHAAATNGSARGVVALPEGTLDCRGGELTLSFGQKQVSADIGEKCSFDFAVSSGTHSVKFSDVAGSLSMGIS